jgi:hypothetical protein
MYEFIYVMSAVIGSLAFVCLIGAVMLVCVVMLVQTFSKE